MTIDAEERAAAVAAVGIAMEVCRAAQGRLAAGHTLTKGDDSPVTVADFAAQAVVTATLTERAGPIEMVGEETDADLAAGSTLATGVGDLVRLGLGRQVTSDQIRDWIGLGAADGTGERFWTLDPIDGTKGFLRGDQYAIALALVEFGEVRLGVLGCPNLPTPGGGRGAVFVADAAGCEVVSGDRGGNRGGSPVSVTHPEELADARVCESVEAGHSDHDQAAEIASRLGIRAEPYRIDSQCKYGVVARGDASIYLRLPTRPGYREKIWDHAAGKFVVERAGGRVTDVSGAPLEFGRGRTLDRNRGVIATDGRFHDQVLEAVADVLGADVGRGADPTG